MIKNTRVASGFLSTTTSTTVTRMLAMSNTSESFQFPQIVFTLLGPFSISPKLAKASV
jgi:hypothetical protein